jgi:hypothetical protein
VLIFLTGENTIEGAMNSAQLRLEAGVAKRVTQSGIGRGEFPIVRIFRAPCPFRLQCRIAALVSKLSVEQLSADVTANQGR